MLWRPSCKRRAVEVFIGRFSACLNAFRISRSMVSVSLLVRIRYGATYVTREIRRDWTSRTMSFSFMPRWRLETRRSMWETWLKALESLDKVSLLRVLAWMVRPKILREEPGRTVWPSRWMQTGSFCRAGGCSRMMTSSDFLGVH